MNIGSVRHISPWLLVAVTLSGGCAGQDTPDARAFLEWVSTHAVPVPYPDSLLQEENAESFSKAIGDARLVGIGESRHDTREQLLMKGLFVRHLVEDLGFRVLILEESFPHAEVLDRYVTGGEGDLREIMNSLAGWYLWDTEEMLVVVEWIRDFNRGRPDDQHVRLYGMDITAPAPAVRAVLDALRDAGIDLPLDANALGLEVQQGDFWPLISARYGSLSEERRLQLSDNYETLVESVKAHRDRLVASQSVFAYERLLLMARIGRLGNDFFLASGVEDGGVIREDGMTQAVLWILNHASPSEKAIMWAHNLHVARSPFRMPGFVEGELRPMGIQLGEAFGDGYLSIGGTFGEGVYPPDLPPGERRFDMADESVVDGALATVGLPHFLVDLRAAEQHAAASRWLEREQEWLAQDAVAVLVPRAAFDLVYYVQEISRSLPTPLALRSFKSLNER